MTICSGAFLQPPRSNMGTPEEGPVLVGRAILHAEIGYPPNSHLILIPYGP